MSDEAHVKTDEYIEALRQKIAKEYKAAEQDAQQKLNQYLERFADRDKKMRAKLDRGEITQTAYREWKVRQITTGTRFQDLRDSIANEYHHASEMAQKYAKDALPDVYALNHNYATYSIEKEAGIDTSYTLYNHDAVERLIRDNPKLLPDPDPEGETAKKLAENKDLRWNREHITSAITRGIMTGDSIDQLAKRLRSVTNMDNAASVRNARTAVTSAQNAGREDAYKRAERMNIDLVREWVATLDNRTRDSHRALHGEERDGDTFSNGLEYPGDMSANVDPSEIYNCRCTMISHVAGFPVDIPKSSPKMTESFDEWQKGKKKEQPKKEESKKEELNGTPEIQQPKFEQFVPNGEVTIEEFREMKGSITKAERQNVYGKGHFDGYVASVEAKYINEALRNGEELTGRRKEIADTLQAVIDKNTVGRDITVTRYVDRQALQSMVGVALPQGLSLSETLKDPERARNLFFDSLDALPKSILENGSMTYTEKAFLSTSAVAENNVMSYRNICLKINVPASANGYVTTNAKESEIIFGQGTELRLVNCELQDNRTGNWKLNLFYEMVGAK